MAVLSAIADRVSAISEERALTPDSAFGYWYLEDIEDLSEEEAENTIVGGPWDGGRDAVYYDEEQKVLRIYQMKYSASRAYVLSAFKDLQRGLQAEYKEHPERFVGLDELSLIVVTKHNSDDAFAGIQKAQQKRIRAWLTRRGLHEISRKAHVEVFDLRKFAQLFERLYGVDAELQFRQPPIRSKTSVLGLVDARGFVPHIDREELLAFNIRKFLGIRSNSVNARIKETLENDDDRQGFWTYNNGIVCLCTRFAKKATKRYRFSDLTIVNGAQTISTIARFLSDNPAVFEDEPIWVVCKAIKVVPTDLGAAMKLTQTSNTQTPANGRDLRAVDQSHARLAIWLKELGFHYVYKRGGSIPKGSQSLSMKDLAQAYVAYWERSPHVAFARAGAIFGANDLYDLVFPTNEFDALQQSASREARHDFARKRILPALILKHVRGYLGSKVKEPGEDKKWKSLAYHMVYAYGLLLSNEKDLTALMARSGEIVSRSAEMLFEGLKNIADQRQLDIPKTLKTDAFQLAISEHFWTENYFGKHAKKEVAAILAEK